MRIAEAGPGGHSSGHLFTEYIRTNHVRLTNMKRLYDSGAQKRKQRAKSLEVSSKLRKMSAFFSSQTATNTNSATEPASVVDVVEEDVATSLDSSHSTSAFTGN